MILTEINGQELFIIPKNTDVKSDGVLVVDNETALVERSIFTKVEFPEQLLQKDKDTEQVF